MFVENRNNKRWCKAWQGEEGGHKKEIIHTFLLTLIFKERVDFNLVIFPLSNVK